MRSQTRAREEGIAHFSCLMLSDNRLMRSLAHHVGVVRIVGQQHGTIELIIDLSPVQAAPAVPIPWAPSPTPTSSPGHVVVTHARALLAGESPPIRGGSLQRIVLGLRARHGGRMPGEPHHPAAARHGSTWIAGGTS